MGKTIAELISSLPEEERIILTLHFLKGKSSGDIAEMLSVPERSVTSILESGKKRLTQEIGL